MCDMNNDELNRQVREFHLELVEFVKKYQFRDRNEIVSCGISVSQCYLIETLVTYGSLTVQDLANKMYLKISTVTRVVDQLVQKCFIRREKDARDLRYSLIVLTDEGKKIYNNAWESLFQHERSILEKFKLQDRKVLIRFLKELNQNLAICSNK